MEANIRIYDEDVFDLLDKINQRCREVDSGKYGLPPKDSTIKNIVYHWLYQKNKATSHQADPVDS